MSLHKTIIVASFLLIVSLPAFAASSQEAAQDQKTFNHNVLSMDRDASVFLHSLALLKAENGKDVQNFMEYKLDEIVCAAWEMQEKMNPSQKKQTMAFLQEIKAYRAKNPRVAGMTVDPQKFSEYYEPFNSSYAQRADEILAGLQ
jgi:hypothetical protein